MKTTIINSKKYLGEVAIIDDFKSFLNIISVPLFKNFEKKDCLPKVLISLKPLKLSSIL